MLGAMFRLFWNSSKRVNPCKASRIIRMLHHSPTRSKLRAMGQGILPKLLRCISKPYASDYHCASDMPTGFALTLPCKPPEPRQPKLLRGHTNYHDASDMAELVVDISSGADNWATHLVTSGAGRAATFGMILIVQGFQTTN